MAGFCFLRRKHQCLAVAAVYVFCSMGMMHQDFPFPLFQTSRGTQAEDAVYYPLQDKPGAGKGVVGSLMDKIASISGSRGLSRQGHLEEANSKWDENPIFALNLPGSGTQTAFRYFKCGLGSTKDVALYWAKIDEATALQGTPKRNSHREIGTCFQNNLQKGNPPLEGCGRAKVWASMGYSTADKGQCFYPSMVPAATEALAAAYPKATILQVTQDPDEWYDSSYPRFRTNMARSCRDLKAPIPAENATRAEWISFYKWHEASVRIFAKGHPSLQYVEVDLKSVNAAPKLEEQLGFPRDCWQPPKRLLRLEQRFEQQGQEQAVASVPAPRPPTELVVSPPGNLPYPIFVASLPKSGTTSTQRFFQCGLGYYEAGHHWTHNKTTDKALKIGKCMESNIQHNRSIFDDCGEYKVWTDMGYFDERTRDTNGKPLGCFYPTIHGGLEAFYQSHPTGTIMNVLRDPAEWYKSAMAWRKLPLRLSKHCSGFPPRKASATEWIEFYKWHTKHIREFAKQHPSLTFLEVSLEANETDKILQERTGIPDFCWGDCNPNSKKKQCKVLKKMREHKIKIALEERERRESPSRSRSSPTAVGELEDKDRSFRNDRKGTAMEKTPPTKKVLLRHDPKWSTIEE